MQDIYDYIMNIVDAREMLKVYLVFHPRECFEYYVKRRLNNILIHNRNGSLLQRMTVIPTDELQCYDRSFGVCGILHNIDDLPAIENTENGSLEWYKYGKRHRVNGPAVVTNAITSYYVNGKLHRDDGPASIYHIINRIEYYRDGMLHRDDGPAIITDICKVWRQCGELHRDDGPAIEYYNGDYVYYFHGILHRDMNDGPAKKYMDILTYCEYGIVYDKVVL